MFGNRLGWGISGALTAVVVLILVMLAQANTISAPSKGAIARKSPHVLDLPDHPEKLEEIKLPFTPSSVVPTMTKSQDAAPLYRQALAEVAKDRYRYDTRSKFTTKSLADVPALKLVIEARDCNTMNMFAAHPEEVLNEAYKLEPEAILALHQLGETSIKLAENMMGSDDKQALELSEAAFSLGVKMCQERLRWSEFEKGHQLIAESAYWIGKLDPARADAAKAANDSMVALIRERCMPLAHAITGIDPEVMGRTAGDMFYIVKNAKERMWRIEAMLKLGHYKFNAGEPGNAADQRGARVLARQIMNTEGEDPLVRTAAKLAYELTFERYQNLGNN